MTVGRHDPNSQRTASEEKSPTQILSAQPIKSFALIKYLRFRQIPEGIAGKYLQEIRYKIGDKT